jgi:hypothetical protein
MSFTRMLPPASARLRARVADACCGVCWETEKDDRTGRLISIPHRRKFICETCIDFADDIANCARLARSMPKATRKRAPGQPALRRRPAPTKQIALQIFGGMSSC